MQNSADVVGRRIGFVLAWWLVQEIVGLPVRCETCSVTIEQYEGLVGLVHGFVTRGICALAATNDWT